MKSWNLKIVLFQAHSFVNLVMGMRNVMFSFLSCNNHFLSLKKKVRDLNIVNYTFAEEDLMTF